MILIDSSTYLIKGTLSTYPIWFTVNIRSLWPHNRQQLKVVDEVSTMYLEGIIEWSTVGEESFIIS